MRVFGWKSSPALLAVRRPNPFLSNCPLHRQSDTHALLKRNLQNAVNKWTDLSSYPIHSRRDRRLRELQIDPLIPFDLAFAQNPQPLLVEQRTWTREDSWSVLNFYQTLLEWADGNFTRALCWGKDEEGRKEALADLTAIVDGISNPEQSTVLVLASGHAPILEHLLAKGIAETNCVCVDFNQALLTLGKATFPRAEFVQADCFLPDDPWFQALEPATFDYVFADGLFSVRPKSWTIPSFNQLVLDSVQRLFSYSRRGFSFCILPETNHYYSDYNPLFSSSTVNLDLGWRLPHLLGQFHIIHRLNLVVSLSQMGFVIDTLPANYRRLRQQTPIYLFTDHAPLPTLGC